MESTKQTKISAPKVIGYILLAPSLSHILISFIRLFTEEIDERFSPSLLYVIIRATALYSEDVLNIALMAIAGAYLIKDK
jgi:hypothetical protein